MDLYLPARTMVSVAINNGWLTRDPFRDYEIKKEETERGFPQGKKYSSWTQRQAENAKQELYRDLFRSAHSQGFRSATCAIFQRTISALISMSIFG